jgi:RNA recognition motif-containing protein
MSSAIFECMCLVQGLSSHCKSIDGFVSAEVMFSTNNRSRGYGIVEFTNQAAAEKAIESLNETNIGERKVLARLDRGVPAPREKLTKRDDGERVASDRPVQKRGAQRSNIAPLRVRAEDEGRLLYVGNIPWRSSWQDIKDAFKECGEVIRVDIPTDRQTRRSRGFATVLFDKPEDADAAIAKLNDTDMGGRTITVRHDQFIKKGDE